MEFLLAADLFPGRVDLLSGDRDQCRLNMLRVAPVDPVGLPFLLLDHVGFLDTPVIFGADGLSDDPFFILRIGDIHEELLPSTFGHPEGIATGMQDVHRAGVQDAFSVLCGSESRISLCANDHIPVEAADLLEKQTFAQTERVERINHPVSVFLLMDVVIGMRREKLLVEGAGMLISDLRRGTGILANFP